MKRVFRHFGYFFAVTERFNIAWLPALSHLERNYNPLQSKWAFCGSGRLCGLQLNELIASEDAVIRRRLGRTVAEIYLGALDRIHGDGHRCGRPCERVRIAKTNALEMPPLRLGILCTR